MIRLLAFLALSLSTAHASGQKISIEFRPVYNGHSIKLGDTLINPNDNSTLVISALRFYVGQFELVNSQNQESQKYQEYYLIDLALPESMHINLNANNNVNADLINFSFGVDSLTNNSGALSGALDPVKGMYWAWQSGYINMKLEGFINSSSNSAVKFEYHLGGFLSPFESIQRIQMDLPAETEIIIEFELDKFLSDAREMKKFRIMSPSLKAKALSKSVSESFKINHEK